jgi:16S rRNA processing protein RimM
VGGVAQAGKNPVVLGRVSGLYGVKGWVKIHSYTDPRESILRYSNWMICRDAGWQSVNVAEGKPHGKTLIARFDGVEDRDDAAGYVNADVAVERGELPETGEGEYYWSDLEGLRVVKQDGRLIGRVAYLLETGANDVLVVRDGSDEVLIPFVRGDVIKGVDLAGGVISVDWEWD